MKTLRLSTMWLAAAVGCGTDDAPAMADGTGTGGPTDTDTDTDAPSSTSPPPECFGEGAMDPFGTSGSPDRGDQECAEHELCVIDQCEPIPFAPVDACASPVSPAVENVALPVALEGIAAADLDDDGADEIWGFDLESAAIRGFDLDANEVAALDLELEGASVVTARREAAPDSLLLVTRAMVADAVEWSLVHAWPVEGGLELAEPQTLMSGTYGVHAHDFDGDGAVEIVLDHGEDALEVWSVAPESAPVLVESRAGSSDVVILPLPDGGGLGLALRGPDPEALEYYAVTGEGLEHVATRSIAQGMPHAYAAFRDASTIELFVARSESLSEFDHAHGYGLGTVDASAVQAPMLWFFSLLDSAAPAVVADLDDRPVAVLHADRDTVFIRFDADGTPCATRMEIDGRGGWTVGDFDGDGRTDLLRPTDDGVTIFSAP